jgi:hypothetical protein
MNVNKSVNYSELFHFRDPFSSRWLRLDPISDWVVNVAIADRLAFGEWQPPEPVVFRGYMGGPIADILWTGLPPLFCVSEMIVKILKENNFTGWATYPVEVSDRKGNRLPGYQGFAVTSYAGKRDLSRSPIIRRAPYVPGGGNPEVYKGFYFDEAAWDGSDFFRVHPSDKIVTRAVKDAFTNAKIRNVKFIALPDEETDTIIYRKYKGKQE